eukprot:TRINITY_DN40335_c0_g2_i1.p1 TRINITY_DN40335_c0_g2~~TRINITY_DN40335_c0_g2_i1.p1  ORF type:complete len:766 (-),score=158.69 TRINITY_DN40335_c0_g2_i1:50-2059(-)
MEARAAATVGTVPNIASVDAAAAEGDMAMDCVSLVAKSGGLEVVTGCMRRFPTSERLQQCGCKCLGLLARGTGCNRVSADYKKGRKAESAVMLRGQARRLIARYSGVPLLLEAMRRFPANAPLQAAGCMAMGQLGSSELRIRRHAAKGGVVSSVIKAMVRHSKDVDVQRYACAALRQLASNAQDSKDRIAELGGIERLCEVGHRYSTSGDGRITAEALGALCHLASKHPANKKRMFDADSLKLVMLALAAEPEPKIEIAMAGCGLLHNMACDNEIKCHIVNMGGREAAERLENHSASPVRSLARLLGKTLAPQLEKEGDAFSNIFAARTPGMAGARRVASKRGRKHAKAAILAVGEDIDEVEVTVSPEERRTRRNGKESRKGEDKMKGIHKKRAADDDGDMSESNGSDASDASSSAGSAASGSSTWSARSQEGHRRPQGRHRARPKSQLGSARRFGKEWDEEAGGKISSGLSRQAEVTWDNVAAATPGLSPKNGNACAASAKTSEDDEAEDARSACSSDFSDTASQLSIEANECLERGDLAGALAELQLVKVRPLTASDSQERRRHLKASRHSRGSLSQCSSEMGGDDTSLQEAYPGSLTMAERISRTVNKLEQAATKKLDHVGNVGLTEVARCMDKAGDSLRAAATVSIGPDVHKLAATAAVKTKNGA